MSEQAMIYAPVVITTLCRDQHFIRCVESLKKNTWAKYTHVYIGLDYPAKESHWPGYNAICEYLEGDFSEFAGFHVIKREENYGSGKNAYELRNYVFSKYDRLIRTDDDIEFSANFLEYMDKCLRYYEKDKDVIAVTGYAHPIGWKVEEGCNTFKADFICPMWGTGFWRDSFYEVSNLMLSGYLIDSFDKYVKEKKLGNLLDVRFAEYVPVAIMDKKDTFLSKTTDVAIGTYMALENKYVIMPVLSKTRNHGFDGSGECCSNLEAEAGKNWASGENDPAKRKIDMEQQFVHVPDDSTNCEKNKRLLNQFDNCPEKKLKRAKFALIVYKILGKRTIQRVWKLLKK